MSLTNRPRTTLPINSVYEHCFGSRWQLTKCVSVICRPQGLSKGSLSWGSGPLHSHPLSQFWWTYPCLRHFLITKLHDEIFVFPLNIRYRTCARAFPTKNVLSKNLCVLKKKELNKITRKNRRPLHSLVKQKSNKWKLITSDAVWEILTRLFDFI